MAKIQINSIVKLPKDWRDILAYFFFGVFNPFGYCVMLTAAHDILHKDIVPEVLNNSDTQIFINSTLKRDCNQLSTGSILLADSVPAMVITAIISFLTVFPNLRLFITILLGMLGYILLAVSDATWVDLSGVAIISLATGLGEITILGYSSYYTKDVISAWSSGAAAAGLLSSITHAGLTALGVPSHTIFLGLLVVPVFLGLSFWCLLTKPNKKIREIRADIEFGSKGVIETKKEPDSNLMVTHLKEIPSLMKYVVPIFLVYLFQYFINQGLSELIEFEGIWLDHASQYRWIQVIYQIGKLIGQSSGSIVIDNILLLSMLQSLNVIFFTVEVLYYVTPYIWIIFIISFWEGILGGCTYVHAFRRVSIEVPIEKQNFALGMTTLSDMLGIVVSGFLAIPAHNALCQLPKPTRLIMK